MRLGSAPAPRQGRPCSSLSRCFTIGSACTQPWATALRLRRGPAWRPSPCALRRDILIYPLHTKGGSPVTVTLERRALIVHARVEEHAPEGYSLVYQEYEVGDFECQFTLAGEFDADKIEANLTNGVLRLTIPKAAEAQARTIQIKAGS